MKLTQSVYEVHTRLVCDAVSDCLAEEHANVKEGGRSDGEALLAVPNNVPLVGTQAVVGVLLEEDKETTPIKCVTVPKPQEQQL